MSGPLWQAMDARPSRSMAKLTRDNLPPDAGVYAIYRDGAAIYIGKAGSLRDRVWAKHSGRGKVMTGSAFRRNVAEHLGIATASDIASRRYQPSPEEVVRIRSWIEGCEIAWITRPSEPEAVKLETAMKDEWMPPLTKR